VSEAAADFRPYVLPSPRLLRRLMALRIRAQALLDGASAAAPTSGVEKPSPESR